MAGSRVAAWLFFALAAKGALGARKVRTAIARRSSQASGLPDPKCHTGVVSLKVKGEAQVCCAGYCGECTDYPTCGFVRGQNSTHACCKTKVLERKCGSGAPANVCLKSCSESLPPCILDEQETFKAPDKNILTAGTNCTEAVKDWRQAAAAAMQPPSTTPAETTTTTTTTTVTTTTTTTTITTLPSSLTFPGATFTLSTLTEGTTCWSDRSYVYTDIESSGIPSGTSFWMGPHKSYGSGSFTFYAAGPGRFYFWSESTGALRNGGWASTYSRYKVGTMKWDLETEDVYAMDVTAGETVTLPKSTSQFVGGFAFGPVPA